MTGDKPSIMVRANGEKLGPNDETSFKVTVLGADGQKTGPYTANGTAITLWKYRLMYWHRAPTR
jgi:hypothetical protein